jgi:hypothetical protein|tara:strand:+ start:380 stop:547 length:168 start_codon:yes stop_codon:yes gene_type:complete
MSVEIELSLKDYKTILNWYELAFAKSQSQKTDDDVTFKKISVMCLQKLEDEKDEE